MAKKIVLAGACRTAIGVMGGTLSTTPATDLGAIVIKEALNRAGVPAGSGRSGIYGLRNPGRTGTERCSSGIHQGWSADRDCRQLRLTLYVVPV